MLHGHIDSVVYGYVNGWVLDKLDPNRVLAIKIYDNNYDIVAEGNANIVRHDLDPLGYGVKHGFSLLLQKPGIRINDINFIINRYTYEAFNTNLNTPVEIPNRMEIGQFLHPEDLRLTYGHLKNVLFIGSCMSADLVRMLGSTTETNWHHILMNNAMELPDEMPADPESIQAQIIQIPIRHVLTDLAINPVKRREKNIDEFFIAARNFIDAYLDAAIKYHLKHGIMTCIMNFIVPQKRYSPSLSSEFTLDDLTTIIEELNRYLVSVSKTRYNVQILDANGIASSLGKRYFIDDSICFTTHGGFIYSDWDEQERNPWWGGRVRAPSSSPDIVAEVFATDFSGGLKGL